MKTNRNVEGPRGERKTFFSGKDSKSSSTFFKPLVQAKLTIGASDDPSEREADTVAEKVVRGETIQTIPILQRKCALCEQHEDDDSLQRKEADSNPVTESNMPTFESRLAQSHTRGKPLPEITRNEMENGFGTSFSEIKIHDYQEAHSLSNQVQAKAFTHGKNIYFNRGQFNPASTSGKILLAHELTHTIQQGASDQQVVSRQFDGGVEGPHDAGLPGGVPYPPSEPDTSAEDSRTPEHEPAPTVVPTCTTPFTPATSFQSLIALIQAAELRLARAGITDPMDQIHALRGIFYGTMWSLDYRVERSTVRNEGFQRFTRPSQDPARTVPRDIRPLLDCGLFAALQASQDVTDGTRHLDFGHLIIGLDARYDPARTANVQYPAPIGSVDMGGSGLELVTWLGDLGGAAASLATRRGSGTMVSASTVFTGSDYGGSINLEGDIAAFVVATGSSSSVTMPVITGSRRLSDALQDYLSPASTSYTGRATTFLSMYGGTFDPSTHALTNASTLITLFSRKIQVFACNYLASRVRDGHLTFAQARAAASRTIAASDEVATAFVGALQQSITTGGRIEATTFPTPNPATATNCTAQIAAGSLLGIF